MAQSTSTYEAIYLLPANLDDDQVNTVVEKYKKVVTDNGGEVEHAAKWEKRKLAYECNGHREGTYCLMVFNSEHSLPAELSRIFRISDDVFRARIYRRDF